MSLLVVGALHWDVIVCAPRMPRIDETLRGTGVTYQFGGKGGNQAVAAAAAGARVAFAGRVGQDDAGAAMRTVLVEAGIDVSQLQVGQSASGMSSAIVTGDGDYGAVIVTGENHSFEPQALKIPSSCRAVLLQNEMAPGLIETIAEQARQAGAHVFLNAAPAIAIGAAELAALDTLVVNRVEGADLLGRAALTTSHTDAIEALKALAPHARIILTLGADGVCFAEAGGPAQHQSAARVAVCSTHGAGDVFVGTYAAACLAGHDLAAAVRSGQDAAARHIAQTR